MPTREPTATTFLKDVSGHSMTVLLDQGLYRHLKFRAAKDSWNMWFEIVTWPNHLTISGDMGTWCFSRIDDMFEFFHCGLREGEIKINPSYWGEKLQNGVHGGSEQAKEFDADVFKEEVIGRLDGWDLTAKEKTEVLEKLRDEVFHEENSYDSYRALCEFSCNGVSFDCELPDGKKYVYHYLWCLYAIVWGIQQYDAAKHPA